MEEMRIEHLLKEVIYNMVEEIKDSEFRWPGFVSTNEPCHSEYLLSLVCFCFIIP